VVLTKTTAPPKKQQRSGKKYIKISFIIHHPFGEEIINNHLGGTCGRHGVEEKVTGTWCGDLTERDNL
jgi:hypothetical protein